MKTESETTDELPAEYDLRSLRVRKLGAGRKSFGDTIGLKLDEAEIFPDADSLTANEATNNPTDSF